MLHPFGPILKSPATFLFLFLTELFERMLWGGGGGGGGGAGGKGGRKAILDIAFLISLFLISVERLSIEGLNIHIQLTASLYLPD